MEIMTLNPSLPFTLESGFGNSNLSFHVSELVFLSAEFFFHSLEVCSFTCFRPEEQTLPGEFNLLLC